MFDSYRISLLPILASLIVVLSISACKSSKDALQNEETKSSVDRSAYDDKISAQIKEGVAYATIEKRYAEYKLTYKGLTSKSQNIMLFTFDDDLISNEDMVKKMSKDKDIVSANSLSSITKKTSASRSSDKKTVKPVVR